MRNGESEGSNSVSPVTSLLWIALLARSISARHLWHPLDRSAFCSSSTHISHVSMSSLLFFFFFIIISMGLARKPSPSTH